MDSEMIKEPVIQISGVKKKYQLGQFGRGTLTADLQSWWARLRGKEDPNTVIGQAERVVGTSFMALNGVDLVVNKGDAVGIIGKNGAGKSTLLKLLCRITAPTEGEIRLNGRIASMLEVGTGFNGEMTGRENVYMNGTILGMSKEEIDSKMDAIIAFSECGEFIDTPVKRYSSGMFVKLAFSVAAHLESEIMIMDEVLAVGDMAFQKKCLEKMKSLATNESKTILYVSHNMSTIKQLCSRVVVLNEGKKVFDGGVEEGIALYMDETILSDTHFEFQKCNSFSEFAFCSFDFLGDTPCRYTEESPLHFKIGWEAHSAEENVMLFVTLLTMEQKPIGSCAAHIEVSASRNTTEHTLDLSRLADGKYCMQLSFVSKNENGGLKSLGEAPTRFYFEKSTVGESLTEWHSNWWGETLLPEVKTL